MSAETSSLRLRGVPFQVPAAEAGEQDLPTSLRERRETLQLATMLLLYCVACIFVLACAIFLVCCMYDAAAHWRHRSHFHSCMKKVQRVHEVCQKPKGESLLCPCCVEFISNEASPSKVVFLCGHRYHIDCVNKWFKEHMELGGRCPICEGPRLSNQATSKANANACNCTALAKVPATDKLEGGDGNEAGGVCVKDEAECFMLGSLHRDYPEIITEACVQRWASCHTEIWLAELVCPRYFSIMHKQPK